MVYFVLAVAALFFFNEDLQREKSYMIGEATHREE